MKDFLDMLKLTSKVNVVNKKISERNKNEAESVNKDMIDTNDTTEKFDWPV